MSREGKRPSLLSKATAAVLAHGLDASPMLANRDHLVLTEKRQLKRERGRRATVDEGQRMTNDFRIRVGAPSAGKMARNVPENLDETSFA